MQLNSLLRDGELGLAVSLQVLVDSNHRKGRLAHQFHSGDNLLITTWTCGSHVDVVWALHRRKVYRRIQNLTFTVKDFIFRILECSSSIRIGT